MTPASDIYALGVVLFQMLTGTVPFDTRSSIGSLVQLLQEEAPAPSTRISGLDSRWDAVVLRCLEKRPEDRFSSAEEVLKAWQGGRRIGVPSRRRRRFILGSAALASLLVVAGLTAWWSSKPTQEVLFEAGEPLQLTADAGLEIDPAFSSDGSILAYAADRGGGFEIYTRSMEPGAQDVAVTQDGRRNMQPSWSPDGSGLAYVSQEAGGIWWISTSGDGEPRRLTEFGSRPAWSPDGRWLVFQEDSRKEISERTLAALPPSTLWRVPAAGGSPERLTRVGEPVGGHGEPNWSPDCRWVAFSTGNRRLTQIWAVEVDTGQLQILVDEARVSVSPVYGPDGRNLFYVGIAEEDSFTSSFAVWRRPLDPETGAPVGEAQKITRLGLASIRQMILSPDAELLVYAALSTVSGLHQLELDAEGLPAGEPDAWPREGQRNSRPRFSMDGRWVAYDRWQMGRNLDIWAKDLSGKEPPRQLTLEPSWDSQANWLNDGSLVYFSDSDDLRGIWRLDPSTGERSFLADIGPEADWARISPDGDTIAFHSSDDSITLDIWIHDLTTGETRRLTRDPELAGFPIWSPDGARLAIEIKRGDSTQVAVIPFTSAAEVEIVDSIEPITSGEGDHWPYSWAPDNDRIAFAGRKNGFWNLYWVSTSTGELAQLTEKRDFDGYVRYPDWSPDGGMIVYEEARTVGDLWQVELTRP